MGRTGDAFERLVEVMRTLRGPGGCPWDREQTLETLKTYLIEEAYEVLQAIEDRSVEGHCEELGDLLMQVVFQAEIARENGWFDMAQVCERAAAKLRHRHPHVFGEARVCGVEEILQRWEGYKRDEGKGVLEGIPQRLPALLMALRLSEKVSRVGFDWPDLHSLREKMHEEVGELEDALEQDDREGIEEEIGDVLFVVANIARRVGIDPEGALRKMLKRFRKRFSYMENKLAEEGRKVSDVDLPTLDQLWTEAKS